MQFTNIFKKTILVSLMLFSVVFLISCKNTPKPTPNPTPTPTPQPTPNPNNEYKEHELDKTYYQGVDFQTKNDEEFIKSLRKVTREKHTNYTSYNEVRHLLTKTDKLDNGKLWGMYNGEEFAPKWTGGRPWNREHVWVNSRLGVPRVKGADRNLAADLHNLRVCNTNVNSARNNFYYVAKNENGQYFDDHAEAQLAGSRKYFPSYKHGGDAIRILLYMIIHYEELNFAAEEPKGLTYQKEGAYIGNVDDFAYLMQKDPVDQFEINRNNRIEKIQGNRNPFIDHPEIAFRVVRYFQNHKNKELNERKRVFKIEYFIQALLKNQTRYSHFEQEYC